MIGKVYAKTVETRVVRANLFQLLKFSKKELLVYAKSIGLPNDVENTKESIVNWLWASGALT